MINARGKYALFANLATVAERKVIIIKSYIFLQYLLFTAILLNIFEFALSLLLSLFFDHKL